MWNFRKTWLWNYFGISWFFLCHCCLDSGVPFTLMINNRRQNWSLMTFTTHKIILIILLTFISSQVRMWTNCRLLDREIWHFFCRLVIKLCFYFTLLNTYKNQGVKKRVNPNWIRSMKTWNDISSLMMVWDCEVMDSIVPEVFLGEWDLGYI